MKGRQNHGLLPIAASAAQAEAGRSRRTKMTSQMNAMARAWRKASADLGIRVEAPYELPDQSGHLCRFAAFVPDFGSPTGALVLVVRPPTFDHDVTAELCAKQHGLWFSCLNADVYADYHRQEFIDILDDWQYFGAEERKPAWYTGTTWTKQKNARTSR